MSHVELEHQQVRADLPEGTQSSAVKGQYLCDVQLYGQ